MLDHELYQCLIERSKVNEVTGCREWQLKLDRGGYGKVKFKRRSRRAPRAMWEAVYGLPLWSEQKLLICHKCDNPKCINIDHLFAGTAKDNTQDMMAKGRDMPTRLGMPKGEDTNHSKLTSEQVHEIRKLHATGQYTNRELGKMFGVANPSIWGIVNGIYWKHLPWRKDDL